jgi:hypothetical protein
MIALMIAATDEHIIVAAEVNDEREVWFGNLSKESKNRETYNHCLRYHRICKAI